MATTSVLILGIGNVLWADEGFGVRAVEAMQRQYVFPDHVKLMDGGTQGIYLVQHVQSADVLIIFDAIDFGLPPATLKCLEGDQVPNFLGAKKMSLHQTGFQEVLAMAEMLGHVPQQLLLIGVQPVELEDYGGSLRPAVKAMIPGAIEQALDYLQGLGIVPDRQQPDHSSTALHADALRLERYEAERPCDSEACRYGDERILYSRKFRIAPQPADIENGFSVDVDHRGKY